MATAVAAQFVKADKSALVAGATYDPGVSDFTIAMWINPTTVSGSAELAYTGAAYAGHDGFRIVLSPVAGNVVFYLQDSVQPTLVTGTFTPGVATGAWGLLIIQVDRDGDATCYYNDSLDDVTIDVSGQPATLLGSAFQLGRHGSAYYCYDGSMAGASLHNRLLTASERTQLYNSGKIRPWSGWSAGLKTDCVSHWELDDGPYDSGTDAADSVGGNDLSFSASPIISPTVLNGGFETVDAFGGELLGNPGFETLGAGDPDFFGTWLEYPRIGSIEVETGLVHGGTNAVKLTYVTGAAYIRQPAAVTAGATYRVSFWTAGDGTKGGQYGVFDHTHATWIVGQGPTGVTAAAYSLVSVDFAVPAGCTSAGIYLWGPNSAGSAYFDDVSLTEITGFANWGEVEAGSSTVNAETSDVYAGAKALRLDVDAGASAAAVTQSAILTLTKQYGASFYGKADATAFMSVGCTTPGGTQRFSKTLTTSWAQYSGTFRPTGEPSFFFGKGASANRTIYLDNVTLTAAEILTVPGPTLLELRNVEVFVAPWTPAFEW